MFFILALNTLFTALLLPFFLAFFAGFLLICRWWSTRFGQLCYLIFLFLLPIYLNPEPFLFSFCLLNNWWSSRYSFWACLLFFFLSLSFWCASARWTGSSLILALCLCFLSVFWLICLSLPFSLFALLLSLFWSLKYTLKSWNLIAVYTVKAGMLSAQCHGKRHSHVRPVNLYMVTRVSY